MRKAKRPQFCARFRGLTAWRHIPADPIHPFEQSRVLYLFEPLFSAYPLVDFLTFNILYKKREKENFLTRSYNMQIKYS